MSNLRTAAQQAMEALENCTSEYGHRCNRCDSEVDEGGRVVTALRAALAQQEQEPLSVDLARALVASRVIDAAAIDDPEGYDDGVMLERVRGLHRRMAALAQQEQEQEPVAWMRWDDDENYYDIRRAPPPQEAIDYLAKWNRPAWHPLYTHPPRREWRSFSEGALMGIYMDFDRLADKQWSNATFILRLMDTVQAKLKERNT
jgi:hypothetical protein